MIDHIAIATKDFPRIHQFYSEVMGFPLIAGIARRAPDDNGFTKHMFYDCGGGAALAIWDLRLDDLEDESWRTGISTGLGLPWHIVHIAFRVSDHDELESKKQRLLSHGHIVTMIEHEFTTSIYMNDPDGNMVEFTAPTRELNEDDRSDALRLLTDDSVPLLGDYPRTVYFPNGKVKHYGDAVDESPAAEAKGDQGAVV
jgi:catechol 2,3-dioxygenase-like lactoylglutathione lyase family enzyme